MNVTAVLTSGGMDSCILAALMAEQGIVHPLYVRAGLTWEEEELRSLQGFLHALGHSNIRPVTVLPLPVQDMYRGHWSVSGEGAPAAGSPEERLFLPGRNILLLGVAAVWGSVHGVSRIAIGTLAANQFPDAQPSFFEAYGRVLSQGLGTPVEVLAPFAGIRKADLLREHARLPLEHTLTCAAPSDGTHCGVCMKCEERQGAFKEAGIEDRTRYCA